MIESNSSPRFWRVSSNLVMLEFVQNSLTWLLLTAFIYVRLCKAFAATLLKSMSSIFESFSTSINFGIRFCFSISFYLESLCSVMLIIIPTE